MERLPKIIRRMKYLCKDKIFTTKNLDGSKSFRLKGTRHENGDLFIRQFISTKEDRERRLVVNGKEVVVVGIRFKPTIVKVFYSGYKGDEGESLESLPTTSQVKVVDILELFINNIEIREYIKRFTLK